MFAPGLTGTAASAAPQTSTGSAAGTVIDAQTGAPLTAANVAIMELQTGTSTDEEGRYELTRVPPGTYTLTVSHVGYTTLHLQIDISANHTTRQPLALIQNALEVDEVLVTGRQPALEAADNLGATFIQIERITSMPAVLSADIFRALEQFPGVQTASDFSSGLHIRGVSPGNTLVHLDGATVYNPSHFLGFFSTFNPDAISAVSLEKTAFSSEHGEHLGSVVGLMHRKPAPELSGNVHLGLLSTGAALRGPHPLGGWSFSIRRSTMEPLLHMLKNREIEGVPESFWFYDVNAHASGRISPEDWVEINFYQGRDDMHFPFQDNLLFDVNYGNRTGGLSWRHLFADDLMGTLQLHTSHYDAGSSTLLTRVPFSRFSKVRDHALSGKLEYTPTRSHDVTAGAKIRSYRFSAKDEHNDQAMLDRVKSPRQATVYLQDRYDPSGPWMIFGGMQGSYFTDGGYLRLSPRITAEYRALESLRLQVGAGRYQQFLTLNAGQLFSSFDLWLPAGEGVEPARSDQITAGMKLTLDESTRLDVEGYLRTLTQLFELDPRRTDGTGQPYEELFHFGDGLAYGVETTLNRSAGRLSGHLAYTYGLSVRRYPGINRGNYYPARFDRRHELDVSLELRLDAHWSFSAGGKFASGQPYTQPQSHYILRDSPYMGHDHTVLVAPQNNVRLPGYRRVEAGLGREGRLFQTAEYSLKLQVFNVFGTRNIWFNLYDYDERYQLQKTAVSQIPVPLPTVTFSVSF